MVGSSEHEDDIYYPLQHLGERLLRILQRKLRDELLNGELFNTLREAQVLIERWRVYYNTLRPHSALRYRPPATETVLSKEESAGQQEAA
jgi:transposase InsO family protein